MLIIHGIYHWKPRRTAFRNDHCRACAAKRLSVLVRTFDVLHLYWIPILPLGFWSRWHCTICGSDPHAVTRTRRGFKIAGAITLVLLAFISWAVQWEPIRDIWPWLLRIGLSLGALAATYSVFRHRPEPQLEAMLAGVQPFEGWTCPLCGGEMLNVPEWHCVACKAEHRPLRVRDR